MKPKTLLIITSDPRLSPRPAEALRIAAGVGAWQAVEVALYLSGPAVRLLSDHPDDLVDGHDCARYLPLLQGANHPIYLPETAAQDPAIQACPWRSQALTPTEVSALAAQANYVLHF